MTNDDGKSVESNSPYKTHLFDCINITRYIVFPVRDVFGQDNGRRAYRIISDLTKNRGISSRVGIRWTLPKKSRSGGRWSGNMVYIYICTNIP